MNTKPTEAFIGPRELRDARAWAVIDALAKECATKGHHWAQSTILAPFIEYCEACGAIRNVRDIAEKSE